MNCPEVIELLRLKASIRIRICTRPGNREHCSSLPVTPRHTTGGTNPPQAQRRDTSLPCRD